MNEEHWGRSESLLSEDRKLCPLPDFHTHLRFTQIPMSVVDPPRDLGVDSEDGQDVAKR